MSVRAIGWVFQNFKAGERGNYVSGQMLVMLAIAGMTEDA